MTAAEREFLAQMKKRQASRSNGWKGYGSWKLQTVNKPNPRKGQKQRRED